MNKFFTMIICQILCILLCTSVHAQVENIENIEKISMDPMSRRIDYQTKYSYRTGKKNEIAYICHYLNAMETEESDFPIPSDWDCLLVEIEYADGTEIRHNIYWLGINVIDNGIKSRHGSVPVKYLLGFHNFIESIHYKRFVPEDQITTNWSDWAKRDGARAISNNLLPAWNQINYTGKIPRVEVCQIIESFLETQNVEFENNSSRHFTDTNDVSVENLYETGIVSGKSETEFYPYDIITREEFALVLENAYTYLTGDSAFTDKTALTAFKDTDEVSPWAMDAVSHMTSLGVIQGYEDATFRPAEPVTKEQAVVMLLRLYDICGEK